MWCAERGNSFLWNNAIVSGQISTNLSNSTKILIEDNTVHGRIEVLILS